MCTRKHARWWLIGTHTLYTPTPRTPPHTHAPPTSYAIRFALSLLCSALTILLCSVVRRSSSVVSRFFVVPGSGSWLRLVFPFTIDYNRLAVHSCTVLTFAIDYNPTRRSHLCLRVASPTTRHPTLPSINHSHPRLPHPHTRPRPSSLVPASAHPQSAHSQARQSARAHQSATGPFDLGPLGSSDRPRHPDRTVTRHAKLRAGRAAASRLHGDMELGK